MKSKNYLLLALLFCITVSAQIKFESGYFINNNGEKINCHIKNLDWNSNPIFIDYKLTESSEILKATMKDVKEFGVDNGLKYIRFSGEMDSSDESEVELTTERNPDFKEVTLFLKVLIEGSANLYSYTNGNLHRYFFNKKDEKIDQLVYKRYIISARLRGENNYYKQQIINSLKCPSISLKDIERLDYEKDKLVSCFLKYNACDKGIINNYDAKVKAKAFHITIKPSISIISLKLESPFLNSTSYFDSNSTFRYGVEGEFVLPFNKSKWAITIEPNYHNFKVDNQNGIIDYKVLDVYLGMRHYMFLNDKSKLYISAALAFSNDLNSKIYLYNKIAFVADTSSSFSFSFGYKFGNKFSIELNEVLARNIISNYAKSDSKYTISSLVLGYTLF